MEQCHRCGAEDVTPKRQDRRFSEAGLQHVILKDVDCRHCAACGVSGVALPHVSALHGELASAIVAQNRFLLSQEVKFLMGWLDWSPGVFCRQLGLHPSFLAVWTSSGLHPDLTTLIPADRLIRFIVATVRDTPSLDVMKILGQIEPHSDVSSLLEASFDRTWSVREVLMGPLGRAAEQRPLDFFSLSTEERWAIDKKLGLLDWDGCITS